MRNWAALAVVFWLSAATGGSAWAQLVHVGPRGETLVRAPFVRVQVGPWGGTYAGPPFASVYAPDFYGPPPFFGPPPFIYPPGFYRAPALYRAPDVYGPAPVETLLPSQVSQVQDVRAMGYRELREALRMRLTKLETQLQQREDGAAWSRYLQPGAIRDLVAGRSEEPADEMTAVHLEELLQEYDKTAADPASQPIANLSGFREVHAALAEFVRPPLERLREQLFDHANALSHSLSRFKTGDGWQRYLLLIDPSKAESPSTPADWSDEDIGQLLDRFESVRGNPEFAVISRLESFQATHSSLAAYVRQWSRMNGLAGEAESLPPAEELPAPED